jgi:hypothetical protein
VRSSIVTCLQNGFLGIDFPSGRIISTASFLPPETSRNQTTFQSLVTSHLLLARVWSHSDAVVVRIRSSALASARWQTDSLHQALR